MSAETVVWILNGIAITSSAVAIIASCQAQRYAREAQAYRRAKRRDVIE